MDENSKNKQETIKKGDNNKLESFIERLERLLEEKNNINFDVREVFSKAKSMGNDLTIIRKTLALQKMDIEERLEKEASVKTYKNVLGIY